MPHIIQNYMPVVTDAEAWQIFWNYFINFSFRFPHTGSWNSIEYDLIHCNATWNITHESQSLLYHYKLSPLFLLYLTFHITKELEGIGDAYKTWTPQYSISRFPYGVPTRSHKRVLPTFNIYILLKNTEHPYSTQAPNLNVMQYVQCNSQILNSKSLRILRCDIHIHCATTLWRVPILQSHC